MSKITDCIFEAEFFLVKILSLRTIQTNEPLKRSNVFHP